MAKAGKKNQVSPDVKREKVLLSCSQASKDKTEEENLNAFLKKLNSKYHNLLRRLAE